MTIDLSEVPAGSRLEKYNKTFPSMLDPDGLFDLLRNMHKDCVMFLKEKLDASFPAIALRWCSSREFEDATLVVGRDRQKHNALILNSGSEIPSVLMIDLQRLLKLLQVNEQTFIVNLTLDITGELLHSLYPLKPEQEINDLLYSLTGEFLCIKVPESCRKSRDQG